MRMSFSFRFGSKKGLPPLRQNTHRSSLPPMWKVGGLEGGLSH